MLKNIDESRKVLLIHNIVAGESFSSTVFLSSKEIKLLRKVEKQN